MAIKKYKQQLYSLLLIFSFFTILFVTKPVLATWGVPGATPPAGNVAAPIYSSSSVVQSINNALNTFGLGVQGLLNINSNALYMNPLVNNNVGIGTNNPQRQLSVGGMMYFGLDGSTASPDAGYLRFGDNTGWKFHIGRAQESSGGAQNTGSTGAIMTVVDQGRVGIGNTAPGEKLQVTGGNIRVDGTTNPYLMLNDGTKSSYLQIASGALDLNAFTAGMNLQLSTNGGKVIVPSANVGIGINNPAKTLDVSGALGATLYASNATASSTSGVTNWLRAIKGAVSVFIGDNDSTAGYLSNEVAGNIRFNGAGVAWGDFGYYPRSATTTATDYGVFRFSTTGVNINTTPNAKVGVGSLYSAGSIGIATTSAGYALNVGGDINFTGNLRQNGSIFTSGTQWTTLGSNIYNNNAGSVGIGTTTPASALHVNGNITVSNIPTYTGTGFMKQTANSTTVVGGGPAGENVTFGPANRMFLNAPQVIAQTNFMAPTVSVGTNAVPTSKLYVVGQGTTAATVNSNFTNSAGSSLFLVRDDGNVGIGTTSPSSSLHIFENDNASNAEVALQSGNGVTVQDKWSIYNNGIGSGDGSLRFWNTNVVNGGNALAILENGNTGIGTTTPGQKLTVAGIIQSSSGGFKFPDGSIQTSAAIGNNDIYDDTVNHRVGINTTTPDANLAIYGAFGSASAAVEGASNGVASGWIIKNGGVRNWDLSAYGDMSDPYLRSLGFNGHFALRNTSGDERMSVLQTGEIGIGTSNPGSLLHLYKNDNTGNAEIALQSGNGGTLQDKWSIYNNGAGSGDGSLRFWNTNAINGGNALSISKTGFVSIGTTTPISYLAASGPLKLDPVDGVWKYPFIVSERTDSNTDSGGFEAYQTNTLAPADGSRLGFLIFGSRWNGAGNSAAVSGYAQGAWASGTSPSYLRFDTTPTGSNVRVERMRIDKDGNVGIGATSPMGKLDVRPDASWLSTTAVTVSQVADNPSLRLYRPTGDGTTAYPWYIQATGSDLNFLSGLNTAIGSETVTPKMTILNGGNVGIGTSNPTAKLEVKSATSGSANSVLKLSDSGGNDLFNVQENGSVSLLNNPPANSKIYLGAKTGILAPAPDASLEVAGIGSAFPATSGSTQSAGLIARFRNNGYESLDIGSNDYQGIWLQSVHKTDLGSNNPLLLNPNGGSVGIGTTTPGYKLSVSGDINFTGNLYKNGTLVSSGGIGGSGTASKLPKWTAATTLGDSQIVDNGISGVSIGTSPDVGSNLTVGSNTTDGSVKIDSASAASFASILKFGRGGVSKWGVAVNYPNSGDYFSVYDYNAGANRMVIDPSTGNVGIGALSSARPPASKLHIYGASNDVVSTVQSGSNALSMYTSSANGAAIYTNASQAMRFGFSSDGIGTTGWSEKMRIDTNGNIGIGTAGPANFKLEVNGTGVAGTTIRSYGSTVGVSGSGSTDGVTGVGSAANSTGLYGFTNDGSGYGVQGQLSGSGTGVLGGSNSGKGVEGYSTSGMGGYFWSGSGPALVTGTGNVGVGVNNPTAAKLQVDGTINGTGAMITGGATGYGVSGVVSGAGTAVLGLTGTNGTAVKGQSSGDSAYGVYGFVTSGVGPGVLGQNNGSGKGVYGLSYGSAGTGVYGQSDSGNAAYFTSATGRALITGSGNVGIGTPNPQSKLSVGGQGNPWATIYGLSYSTYSSGVYGESSANYGYGVQGISDTGTGYGVYGVGSTDGNSGWGVVGVGQYGVYGSGTTYDYSSGGGEYARSGSWVNGSDKNTKENFLTVNENSTLEKIRQLPITEWNYKTDTIKAKHIGPMAQDFYAIFGVGDDDKHISTIDPAGISLVGIKALDKKVEDQQKQIEVLKKEIENLKQNLK